MAGGRRGVMRGYSAIGIVNSKTEANVGGAMRAAACYGASTVIVEGARYKPNAADVTKAWRHIPLFHVDDLWKMMPYDCVPVAIEFIKDARPLPSFTHPERAFYIFGPEDGNIPDRILSRCKNVVMIPTQRCMNLASTVNVVLYDRLVKRTSKQSTYADHTVPDLELQTNAIFNEDQLLADPERTGSLEVA